MKRALLFIAVLSVVFSSGCSWFVPSQIKKEASLMEIDSKTALTEISAIDTSAKGNVTVDGKEMTPAEAVKFKATKSLTRVNAHAVVLNAYMKGEKAPPLTVSEIK